MSKKSEYPEMIQIATKDFLGKFCLYVLEIEPLIYKYGITVFIKDRLRTHYRDMKFQNIIKIFDCMCDTTMHRAEDKLGMLAHTNNELVRKYEKTEIIQTANIHKYLDFITTEITADNHKPQPVNQHIVHQIIDNNPIIDNKKCYSCGKIFRAPVNLEAHKNKKTPCLIRNVDPVNINNPNRCIFYNKIFSTKSNLQKHMKTCKIKNGGMNTLADNVKYEQKFRILEEKDRQKDKEILWIKVQMQEQIDQLRDQLKQITTTPTINDTKYNQ